jgi:hypothetical protein
MKRKVYYKMKSLSEEQIWEIIDGMASPETLMQHKQLLQHDPVYKKHFEQFTTLQAQLMSLDLEVPSMRFTQNVLDNVLPLTQGAYKKDRAPLFFLGAMGVLLSGAIYFLLASGDSSGTSLVLNTEGVVSMFSNGMVLNIFILLNLVLAFIFLDKKVFQPFFSSKMK